MIELKIDVHKTVLGPPRRNRKLQVIEQGLSNLLYSANSRLNNSHLSYLSHNDIERLYYAGNLMKKKNY